MISAGLDDENCDSWNVGVCPCDIDEQKLNLVYVFDTVNSASDFEWLRFKETVGLLVEHTFGDTNDVQSFYSTYQNC